MDQGHQLVGSDDPFGLRHLSAAAFALYFVAVHSTMRPGASLDRPLALTRLRRLSMDGTYQVDYVSRMALKFIDPKGHGANSERLKGPELARFRREHSEFMLCTDALALFLVACDWWIANRGKRADRPGQPLITTSDLCDLLSQLGFLKRERAAIVRIITPSRRLRRGES